MFLFPASIIQDAHEDDDESARSHHYFFLPPILFSPSDSSNLIYHLGLRFFRNARFDGGLGNVFNN